jgi:hypothetical protein
MTVLLRASASILFACALLCGAAAAEEPATTITAETPDQLQEAVTRALAAGSRHLVIAPGVIRGGATGRGQLLRIEKAQDVAIDAAGVTLASTDPGKGLLFLAECRRVTVTGLTVQNDVPPFTQGRFIAVDANKRTVEIAIDAGYPAPKTASVGYVFDPATRQRKSNCNDLPYDGVEKLGEGRYSLQFAAREFARVQRNAELGKDLIAIRGDGRMAVEVANCEAVALQQVVIRAAGVFGILEVGGVGGNRFNFTLTYGPKPDGAEDAPLISSVADGFHSATVRHGPQLDGCLLEGMCDDGIAIHGTYMLVQEVRGRDVYFVARNNQHTLFPGARARFLDPQCRLRAEAVVSQVAPADASFFMPILPKDKLTYFCARMDRDLPLLPAGTRLGTPDASGSGFVIRNCHIRDHRARGMLIKADDGLIEGNTIERSTLAGILVAPQLTWNESCYSRNLIIRNNVLRDCCRFRERDSWYPAALVIKGDAPDHEGLGYGHRNIQISGNRFEDQDGMSISAAQVEGLDIRDNQFIRPQVHPSEAGADHGYDPTTLIGIDQAINVGFSGNRVEDAGANLQHLLTLSPTVTGCSGASDGVAR